jgi:ribosomal protein S18 acetylase RimI-like enzyme
MTCTTDRNDPLGPILGGDLSRLREQARCTMRQKLRGQRKVQQYSITVEEKPSDDDCRFLGKSLYEFNVSQTGLEVRRIAVFLRDGEGDIIGGTLGSTPLGRLHIDILWVRDDVRGQGYGSRLLLAAEQEAIKRECRCAQLETLSFQAPGFYQKLGYKVFAQFDGVADKYTWYFMMKDLVAE